MERLRSSTLPFTIKTSVREFNMWPDRHQLDFRPDSPTRQVVIGKDVWTIYVPDPYFNPSIVVRYKGSTLEDMVRQEDGLVDLPDSPLPGGLQASSFLNSGLWYDEETGVLYALIHTEYEHETLDGSGASWCRNKTRLVSSRDLGLTWDFIGDVLTPIYKDQNGWAAYSGNEFEKGPSDYDLYVDTRSGYFYITSLTGWCSKKGEMDRSLLYNEVARCAISDKMSPGKWFKYNNGTWTEPGLGGKSSRVAMDYHAIYGTTIYNSYIGKYMRIGVTVGTGDRSWVYDTYSDGSVMISTCTDLSHQEWSPMAKLLDDPDNRKHGYTLAADDKIDGITCGQRFHIYNYWSINQPSRVIDVTLDQGTTETIDLPAYQPYSYEPHPEAGDAVESRQTKIIRAVSTDISYSGDGWSIENDSGYYKGQAKISRNPGSSMSFSFTGTDIYWRATGSVDGGKADVFIDGVFQGVSDCYFHEKEIKLKKMFAFIKKGLDAGKPHTIRISVRKDANPASMGTVIRHIAFEYSAESYRAQAGISSIQGKNNWYYQTWDGRQMNDLEFELRWRRWIGSGCTIADEWQHTISDNAAGPCPVRKWSAPHSGFVCLDGSVGNDNTKITWDPVVTYVDKPEQDMIPKSTGDLYRSRIIKDRSDLMSLDLGSTTEQTPYRVYTHVDKGDNILFMSANL
jgi:hypothetical protein